LEAIKVYAAGKRMSVSELVEDYFRSVTRPVVRKNIVEMVDELAKPVLDRNASLKELFYQQQEGKHGL